MPKVLRARPGLIESFRPFRDFAETAAAIARLDAVIAVDTAVAHLAGAMGRPLYLLLPFGADFRWLRERRDSPWYPSAHLFRQQAFNDWSTPIEELAHLFRASGFGYQQSEVRIERRAF